MSTRTFTLEEIRAAWRFHGTAYNWKQFEVLLLAAKPETSPGRILDTQALLDATGGALLHCEYCGLHESICCCHDEGGLPSGG